MELTELVHRIQDGDREAEDDFVRRYARGVRIIIRRACSDASACDDLAQDTLTIALEKIRTRSVRDPERLSGFVASLARNLVIEHGRHAKRNRHIAVEEAGDIRDATGDPLDHLLQAERDAIVRRVIRDLPTERDREILFRYYVDEQDKDEICAALGLTREHFTRVLFRARERYRVHLRRWYEIEPERDKRRR